MEVTSSTPSSPKKSSETSPSQSHTNKPASTTQPSSTKKSPESSPSSPKKSSESKETISSFTWVGRRTTPPPMTFNFKSRDNSRHQVVAKNQFDLKTANQDRSQEFKALLQAVQQTEAGNSPKLQALQDIITTHGNNSKVLVWKIQNWAADYAWIGDKVAEWKLGDAKLGINTYTALLTALYITKSSSENSVIVNQWNKFKGNFTEQVQQGISIAHNDIKKGYKGNNSNIA